jgi:methylamine dehydrogenase heavy chain
MLKRSAGLLALGGVLASLCGGAVTNAQSQSSPETSKPVLPAERIDVATLSPQKPHRYFVAARSGGVSIIDGDQAKVEGTITAYPPFGFAMAPDGSRFYVAESIWTKDTRGERQDLLSIYDGKTLALSREIKLPGRLIATSSGAYFNTSVDGRLAYVANMEPAASVIAVDLDRAQVLSSTATPGCGLVYPFGPRGFVSLCADGSLLSAVLDARGKARTTSAPVFFDAENDPVFAESPVDRLTGRAFFVSYTGVVHPALLGETTKIEEGWSIQAAAGLTRAGVTPNQRTWRPGGVRPFAWHRKSGRLYVLMHEGQHWTQGQAGSQLWVLDTQTHTLLRRLDLLTAGVGVSITQDDEPLLYVTSDNGALWVLNPDTGKLLRVLTRVGPGPLAAVVGF